MKKTFLTIATLTTAATVALFLALPSSGQDGPPAGGPPGGGPGGAKGGGRGRGGPGGPGGPGGGRAAAEPAGPMPKSADGHPDFSGFWNLPDPPAPGVEKVDPPAGGAARGGRGGGAASGWVVDPADGKIPYKPEARAKQQDLLKNHLADEPELNCYQSGVPHSEANRFGAQILMPPGYLVQLTEFLHSVRIIPIDANRKHVDAKYHLFQGDPIAHWDGDTLVVDTTNQNDKTWFDLSGNFKTDGLHVTEKFIPQDANTIVYEATMHDPAIYTADWTLRWNLTRLRTPPNSDGHPYELMEFGCIEGNQDKQHYTEDEGGKAKQVLGKK